MKPFTILHFSDLHLSPFIPDSVKNWKTCLEVIREQEPDHVVIGGDVVLDDPDSEENHNFSQQQLAKIPVPWTIIPGNHDIGDSYPNPYKDQGVNDQRLEAFRMRYSEDFWVKHFGGWTLVGLNSLLIGSGLQDEEIQEKWFIEQLSKAAEQKIGLFVHKPLFMERPDEDSPKTQAAMPSDARKKLYTCIEQSDIRFIASGHLHCGRALLHSNINYIWAPSTGMFSRNSYVSRIMHPNIGWVHIKLHEEMTEFEIVKSTRLIEIDTTEIANKYGSMRAVPNGILKIFDTDNSNKTSQF